MSILYNSKWSLLLLVLLWCCNYSTLLAARTAKRQSQTKDNLDPNVRDWGDYSDLEGLGRGLGLDEDREPEENRGIEDPSSNLAPELDFLANFAGKKRLWVITAPSHSDNYLRMMEKQLEDMEQEGLNCRLAERDTYIVTIIQNAMMEGRIQKTTFEGDAVVESLDPDTVSKLLHYLELTNQDQAFSMLVLKKNLRISERFPYPVRVEAVLEVIDQFPMRKLEKLTRKGSPLRCKVTKKRIVLKKRPVKKKTGLSSQRPGNVTSVLHRRPLVDKKVVLKNKVQDILRGRSRFVIRKPPTAVGSTEEKALSNVKKETSHRSPEGVSRRNEEVKTNRYDSHVEGGQRQDGVKSGDHRTEEHNKKDDSPEKSSSKKKGKGKKGKKGKGRGKKSNREATEKDSTAFKEFVQSLMGTRRLMVISTPSNHATLYTQLKEENEKRHCDFAIRKITMATIVGDGHDATLTLQHYQCDSEPPLSDRPKLSTDPDLISLLRSELGLSSSDLFSMTVTDYDIKPNRVFEAPPSPVALLEYIDNFQSRRTEKEKDKMTPPSCSKTEQQPGSDNPLLRFMSKRRLLLISTPSEDDYSYQQQLSALGGQECPMGIRHFALLKLVGSAAGSSGTVELFPLNGRSQTQLEPLSRDAVNNLREQLKISKDYFSMLVVGKDGDVKAWFPSPMWSLENIYDLVDSMELRVQEEKLQRSLGIHCPEDVARRGGGGYEEEGAEDSYLYHRTQD